MEISDTERLYFFINHVIDFKRLTFKDARIRVLIKYKIKNFDFYYDSQGFRGAIDRAILQKEGEK